MGIASWVLTIFMSALLVAAVVFLLTGRYARKETVAGALEPSAGALRLVSSKAAVIESVQVTEGQDVKAGDQLVRLRFDVTTDSGAPLGTLLDRATSSESKALSDEMTAHRRSTGRQKEELVAKRRGLADHLARLISDVDLARQRLVLQERSLESLRVLNETKVVSDLQLRDRQDAVLQAKQSISAIEKDRDETVASIAQLDAQLSRQDDELATSEAQLSATRAELEQKRANNSVERYVLLTAPRNGRIVALQAKPGEAVTAGSALAILMPKGSVLDVELWAPTRAAGFIKPGNGVRLMFDAFPYQKFGVGHGRVIAKANAPTPPNELPLPIETKESLYRIDVALDRQDVDAYGKRWALSPGMRVTADLVLDDRSFLDWLLDPILAARHRAG